MDVGATFEKDYFRIQNPEICWITGLCNPKCVNHPVESQQMGWKMMFPDYIIRIALSSLDYVIRTLSVERLSLFEIGIVNLTILITIIVF